MADADSPDGVLHQTLAAGTVIHTTVDGSDATALKAIGGGLAGRATIKTLGQGVAVVTEGIQAHGIYTNGGGVIDFEGGAIETKGRGAIGVMSDTVMENGADIGAVLSVDKSSVASRYVGGAALSGGILAIRNTSIVVDGIAHQDGSADSRIDAGPYGLVASGTAMAGNGLPSGGMGALLIARGVQVQLDGVALADPHSAAVGAFDKGVVMLETTEPDQLNLVHVLRAGSAGLRADMGPAYTQEYLAGAIYSTGNLSVLTIGPGSPGVVAANGGRVELVGGGDVAEIGTFGEGSPALYVSGNGSVLSVDGFTAEAGSAALALDGMSDAEIVRSTLISRQAASVEAIGGAPQLNLIGSHVDQNNGTWLDVMGGASLDVYAGNSTMTGRSVVAGGGAAYLTLDQGSVWTVTGDSRITDLTSNDSQIRFAAPSGEPSLVQGYKTLTVSGDYAATDARMDMNVYLAGDGSAGDRMIVGGSTLPGTTYVAINNTGGSGALTRDGIEIVHVGGQSDGLFQLANGNVSPDGHRAVNVGAYSYTLHKGNVTRPGDGNWYLGSQLTAPGHPDPAHPGHNDPNYPTPIDPNAPVRYSAGAPVYEGYMQNMLALSAAPTLQQRTGNRYVDEAGAGKGGHGVVSKDDTASEYGVWARVEGGHNRLEPKSSTTGMTQNINTYIMQAGVDGQFHEDENGRLIAGITGQYGRALGKVKSIHGDGDITTNAWSLGATATWYGNSGFYVDTQGQLTWFDNDLDSRTANTGLASGRKARGYAASIEAGQRFAIDQNWSLTPQAQLSWSRVKADGFDDVFGAHVTPGSGDSLTGRLGLAADYRNSWLGSDGLIVNTSVYGIANVYQEFRGGTHMTLAGVDFKTDTDRTRGGIGAGGSYAWAGNAYAVYGEGSVNTALSHFGKSYDLKGTLGFRVKW